DPTGRRDDEDRRPHYCSYRQGPWFITPGRGPFSRSALRFGIGAAGHGPHRRDTLRRAWPRPGRCRRRVQPDGKIPGEPGTERDDMLKVQRLLASARERLVTVRTDALLLDVARLLVGPQRNLVVVCDDGGRMAGVITKTDI